MQTPIRRPSSDALKRIENKCFKEAIQVVPSKKKMSKKRFQTIFHLLFSSSIPNFLISSMNMGTLCITKDKG
jgi:hypothetical protein